MDSFQEYSSSAVDADDNVFYQELARQLLMLTDEDDDDKGVHLNGTVAANLRRMPVDYCGVEARPVARSLYYSWSETGIRPVSSWMDGLRANGGGGGGGTGVFIPSGAATGRSRKKSGRRRYNNNNNNNNKTKNNDEGRVLYSANTVSYVQL